jgi:hypothetical protein
MIIRAPSGSRLDSHRTQIPVTKYEHRNDRQPGPAAIVPRDSARDRLPASGDGGAHYTGSVSQPLAEPPHLPPATEQQVRTHARQLVSLAARHGITDLAFASPGRLRGHVADDRDLFDMFEFQRTATSLVGAEITLYSDGALNNDHVSPDLAAAAPL